jgi:hypothetical protein
MVKNGVVQNDNAGPLERMLVYAPVQAVVSEMVQRYIGIRIVDPDVAKLPQRAQ